jgi:tetratricopeptide (TPR) repeat protein
MLYCKDGSVEIQAFDTTTKTWKTKQEFDSGFALDFIINIANHAYFPIMNNSVVLKAIDIHVVPAKNAKAMDDITKMQGNDAETKKKLLANVVTSTFRSWGVHEPKFDDGKKTISIALAHENIYQLENAILQFKKGDVYSAAREAIVSHLSDARKDGATAPQYPPRCRCNSIKSRNADFGPYTKRGPVPSWMHEYVCYECLRAFCGLFEVTHNVEQPLQGIDGNQLLNILKSQLDIAEHSLADPLAIAFSLNRLGFFVMTKTTEPAKCVALFSEARSLMKDFASYKNDVFYQHAYQEYQQSIFFLGQVHTNLGQNDQALPYLEESLASDVAEGIAINIAKSMTAIGKVLVSMGRYDEAEHYLIESLEKRRSAGVPSGDTSIFNSLLPIVELFARTGNKEKLQQIGRAHV